MSTTTTGNQIFVLGSAELGSLQRIAKRLFSQDRLDGDSMRDLAQKIDGIAASAIQLDDGSISSEPESDFDPSSPEILKAFADKICALKRSALCDVDTGGGFGVASEQHYLLALDALGTAERFMRLAHCHRMRGD